MRTIKRTTDERKNVFLSLDWNNEIDDAKISWFNELINKLWALINYRELFGFCSTVWNIKLTDTP